MTAARMLMLALLLSTIPICCVAEVAQRHVAPAAVFDSGILKVERFGNRAGPSIVFVPALYCGSWQWNAQINALSKAYDVLVVTLPGFDGRPMVDGDALMQRAAQSLDRLIRTNRLHAPVLVGHSLGGTLAVYFGERYPGDVTGVVTVEGGYPAAPTQAQRDARIAQNVAAFEDITPAQLGPVLRDKQLRFTITRSADVEAADVLAARSDPAAIVAWMRAALTLDLTPDLHRISVPFTAIVPFDPTIDPYQGFATPADKRAAYARWVAHASRGRVVLIAPSRHFVMFDRPQTFERALEAALAR